MALVARQTAGVNGFDAAHAAKRAAPSALLALRVGLAFARYASSAAPGPLALANLGLLTVSVDVARVL